MEASKVIEDEDVAGEGMVAVLLPTEVATDRFYTRVWTSLEIFRVRQVGYGMQTEA